MGAVGNNNHTSKTFYSIVDGKITRRLKEHLLDNQGNRLSVERVYEDKDKNKKTIIEQRFDFIQGRIIAGRIKDTDFGYIMEIELMSDGEFSVLTTQLNSSYARAILFRLPNIDVDKDIKITPYNFLDKQSGDKRVGVSLLQENSGFDGDKIPPFWTKEDPKELPKVVISEDAFGKHTYDSKDRDKYLNRNFLDWCKRLEGVSVNTQKSSTTEYNPLEQEQNFAKEKAEGILNNIAPMPEEESDDLPF